MRELHFQYHMELSFSQPVTNHHFSLRMLPMQDERQTVLNYEVALLPECLLSQSVDAFGNTILYGKVADAHESFLVKVQGTVAVNNDRYCKEDKDSSIYKYCYPSCFTHPGAELLAYGKEFLDEKTDPLIFAEQLQHQLHQDITYLSGSTNVFTTAEDVMHKKEGVCQDFAHVMISLCRMAKIPARYVVGMMQGEGFSHAWVEVFSNGYWYGFDPTNDKRVDDSYIKLSHGRDYKDCMVNRGVFCGKSLQTQIVKVVVQ